MHIQSYGIGACDWKRQVIFAGRLRKARLSAGHQRNGKRKRLRRL
jgi:hypothetical protein